MKTKLVKWTRTIIYSLGIPALIFGAYIQAKDCFVTPDIVPHRRHIECEEDKLENPIDRDLREEAEKVLKGREKKQIKFLIQN